MAVITTPGRSPSLLVLEDGREFRGRSYGATGQTFGEAVFFTGMTGYQETLTDPSYHRQIVVQTAPQIGNTGWNDEDDESSRIWVAGYVVREPARLASNWRSRGSLDDELVRHGVVGISGVDTRAITRHLRDRGALRAGIFSGAALADVDVLVDRVRARPGMVGADLAGEVTAPHPYTAPAGGGGDRRFRVAALDLGVKRTMLRELTRRGVEVCVLPAHADAEDLFALEVDGVFVSNGPGDPATTGHAARLVRAALERRIPLFGICFGHQVLGRALGFDTYKLDFGHHGVNLPVKDRRTGRVEITSHNHGFAVRAPLDEVTRTPFGRVEVSHVCLNDGVIEGLRCLDVPALSLQYHPEAAAGPHDAAHSFDEFVATMAASTSEATRA
ncbi:glutamine-hydrolyzing carbamoyl-phosphate synthase small subunit [Saccharothrix sp. 6-C]|uniref:glutamine-hydrolyzing carbamoyl-phosphate synthase small subunit n=1 Tax=Saccharothrix sp. 6-C TaxID=2781735 RepID=UPI001916F796|nr:glutamine-hydrolyzing carbamoyl-phosphate synthase small subunit [Saccharothrix sp. 6-C]QQQ78801.1 glutamine-hydrolyzing carbamoyl-phosphate synthase small subunit [Saccharothrix sp. 6-C]